MADDNKKRPMQDDTTSQTPGQDQQKGGEATATDQDLADLEQTDVDESTDVPTDTTEDTDETTQE